MHKYLIKLITVIIFLNIILSGICFAYTHILKVTIENHTSASAQVASSKASAGGFWDSTLKPNDKSPKVKVYSELPESTPRDIPPYGSISYYIKKKAGWGTPPVTDVYIIFNKTDQNEWKIHAELKKAYMRDGKLDEEKSKPIVTVTEPSGGAKGEKCYPVISDDPNHHPNPKDDESDARVTSEATVVCSY